MATTLTERFISATTASLPADAQEDVRAELGASIADALESRLEQGEDPAAAERAVLTELGDPAALAANYADRPLHLLGPRYYLAWRRLLTLLLAIIPACAVGGVALAHTIAGAEIGVIIGESISVGITSALHVMFWVTLVFVILERKGSDPGHTWDLDQLSEPRPTGAERSDVIGAAVFAGLMIGALLWDQFRGFVWLDGESFQLLHPQLWPWALIGLSVLLALEVGVAVIAYARHGWSTGLALFNTALAAVWLSAILTLLGNGLLVNPELTTLAFPEGGGEPDTLRVVGVIFVFAVLVATSWDVADGWRKARRDAKR